MKDQWFRWEREASIHLLFPTLEVFYQPLFAYTRVSAPTMVLVIKNGVVTWCIKEDEFIDYGKKLLAIYSNPKKEQRMVNDIKKALRKLKKVEAHQEKLQLSKLNNNDLLKEHHNLYQTFIDYYTMGAIGTPLSFAAEMELKSKGLAGEELNRLTTPDEISYVAEADEYLRETKDIRGFIERYFWINNNYSGTEILSEKAARERLKLLVSKKLASTSTHQNKPKAKLGKVDKRLVELLQHYATYKDDRKKEILMYLHSIDLMLKEIARRMNMSVSEVRASFPFEVGNILQGRLPKKELQERLRYSVIVWKKGKKKALLLKGPGAKKWEENTLAKVNSSSKVIKGTTASPGRVKGKVRVLFKAGDSKQLKQGEVLVTFMTSPDFMLAIRKCSAIITNLGGVTCHAAIISRELKLPCIVGTKVATQVLHTGDLVEVNANQGIVKVLK